MTSLAATAEERRTDAAALAAALATVLLWASAFVGIRSAGHAFSPGPLTLARLSVAVVALALLGSARGERAPSRGQLRAAGAPLLLCGLLSVLRVQPRPERGRAPCRRGHRGDARQRRAGAETLSGTQTVFLCCVIGAAACLPFVGQLLHQLSRAPGGSIGWIGYLGVAPTALGFSTWAFALRRTNAGRLAATTYLVAPLSILLGRLWLGESPAPLAYVGGALCLAGVALSRRR